MKKLVFSALILASTTFSSNAQLADGSIAPDFTVTAYQSWLSTSGMNNNGTYNLYDYLDAGYTVILDVSATWCGPCWNHHLTGALDDLYVNHGPAGQLGVSGSTTDDVMVIWLDGDGTTADATMLDGAGSIGNWIEPNATLGQIPFPMANPITATANQINNGYDIAYFPTIYKICPNRVISEVGQLTAAQFYTSVGTCPPPASAPADAAMLSYDADTYICTGSSHTPVVTIQNNGTTNLTSATITITQGATTVSTGTYTGNLAPYGVASVTCTPITSPTSGAMVATVTTSGDALLANGVINTALTIYTAATAPLTQNFTATNFPYAEYKLSSASGKNWEYSSGTMKYNCYSYSSNSSGDLYIEPVNLTSLTSPTLTFDVAYRGYTASAPENDKLQVFVSTNCGATWTSVYNKQGATLSTGATQTSAFTPASAGDWRNEVVSLAAVAGQSEVFVKYVGTSAYGNNMYIDNINIANAASIEENELAGTSVYPNPASTIVNVAFEGNGGDYTITISDLVGRIVSNTTTVNANGSTKAELSIADLKAGNYLVTISNGSSKFTQTLMVK
jgi:hypothetical protein